MPGQVLSDPRQMGRTPVNNAQRASLCWDVEAGNELQSQHHVTATQGLVAWVLRNSADDELRKQVRESCAAAVQLLPCHNPFWYIGCFRITPTGCKNTAVCFQGPFYLQLHIRPAPDTFCEGRQLWTGLLCKLASSPFPSWPDRAHLWLPQMYLAGMQTPRANVAVLSSLVAGRHELAMTIGQQSFSHFTLAGATLAGSPEAVGAFLTDLSSQIQPQVLSPGNSSALPTC